MNLIVAFTLFSLTILFYWIISDLFTTLFRFTGLPDERARFQVVSLLTGCGFTTRESEMILSSRARRRLARVTMLFGYVFNLTIVTAFINVFLSMKESQVVGFVLGLLIPLSVVVVIIVFMRVPAVRAWGDRTLEKLARKILRSETENTVLLIDHIGKDAIAQVRLNTVPEELREVPLAKTGLKAEKNILVMLIEEKSGRNEPAAAETVFREGDRITVFGDYRTICEVFQAHEDFEDA